MTKKQSSIPRAAVKQIEEEREARLREAISDLSADHLTCRDLGHAWRIDAYRSHNDAGEKTFVRTLICRVCKTIREEQVATDGELLKRRYSYRSGYQFPKGVAGHGGLPKFHFRSEWLKRLTKDEA